MVIQKKTSHNILNVQSLRGPYGPSAPGSGLNKYVHSRVCHFVIFSYRVHSTYGLNLSKSVCDNSIRAVKNGFAANSG